MPTFSDESLVGLLRRSLDGAPRGFDPPTAAAGHEDRVAQRIGIYAELLRLAPPASAQSRGRLLIPAGDGSIRAFPLGDSPLLIGRGSAAVLRVDDAEASRQHCLVRLDAAGAAWLVDLDSANGTMLNDSPVTAPTILRDGDIVQLGHTLLVFARP